MERALVVGLLSLIASSFAQAGELSLLLNGHAVHLEKTKRSQNEANFGAGLQYDLAPKNDYIWFVFGSGFEDSQRNPSYAAGGGLRHRFGIPGTATGFFDVGGAAFLMTRETYRDGEPFPALLPVATVGFKPVAINITYVPKVDPKIVPLVFFEIKYSLD